MEWGPPTPERKPRLTSQTWLPSPAEANGEASGAVTVKLARPDREGSQEEKASTLSPLPLPTLSKAGFSLLKEDSNVLGVKKVQVQRGSQRSR